MVHTKHANKLPTRTVLFNQSLFSRERVTSFVKRWSLIKKYASNKLLPFKSNVVPNHTTPLFSKNNSDIDKRDFYKKSDIYSDSDNILVLTNMSTTTTSEDVAAITPKPLSSVSKLVDTEVVDDTEYEEAEPTSTGTIDPRERSPLSTLVLLPMT